MSGCAACCSSASSGSFCGCPKPPDTLYLTFSNKTGNCTCLPDSLTLTYAGGSAWNSPPLISCQPGVTDYFQLICDSTFGQGWYTASTCGFITRVKVSESCSPFMWVFDLTAQAANQPLTCCPTGGGTVRATITE